jgi:hypothetical protein
MDEKPDEIMNQIESQRERLGQNLNELESRVKRSTDWRAQFDKNPMLLMGAALGGGVLLGSIVGGTKRSGQTSWSSSKGYSASSSIPSSGYGVVGSTSSNLGSSTGASATSPSFREHRSKATDTLEQMKGALIAFATTKLKEFMSEALPGFGNHLQEAERRHQTTYGGHESSGQYGSGQSGSGQSGQYGSGQSGSGLYGTGSSGSGTGTESQRPTGWQSGSSQSGGSGQHNPGNTRTEYSSQSPYQKDTADVNAGRNG